MMEIFFEKKEFFHLKELEKIAPKAKGISKLHFIQLFLLNIIL